MVMYGIARYPNRSVATTNAVRNAGRLAGAMRSPARWSRASPSAKPMRVPSMAPVNWMMRVMGFDDSEMMRMNGSGGRLMNEGPDRHFATPREADYPNTLPGRSPRSVGFGL